LLGLKKQVDAESKAKKRNAANNEEPRKAPRELPHNPAKVKAKLRGVAIDCANMQDATRKGRLVRLVFHLVFYEGLSPVAPPRKEGTLSGSNQAPRQSPATLLRAIARESRTIEGTLKRN